MTVRRRTTLGLTAVVVILAACGALLWRSGIFVIEREPVSISDAGVPLRGMLAFPRGAKGRVPAAVVVHGSGRVASSDLERYARRLVPGGMAVLMYETRGLGRLGGAYPPIPVAESENRLGQLADDVVAAVRYLRSRDDIDTTSIGLLGAGQAGWIMPLAAARTTGIAYYVSIAGPVVTYGEGIYYGQLTGDGEGPGDGPLDEEIDRRMRTFEGLRGFDPIPILDTLSVPSLWILGGRDRSVPTHRSLANLRVIRHRNPGTLDVRVYPEGDHSLRDAGTGRELDYWPVVYEWLVGHVRGGEIARGVDPTSNDRKK